MLKSDPPVLDSIVQSAVNDPAAVLDVSLGVKVPPTLDLCPTCDDSLDDLDAAYEDTSERIGQSPNS